ncbi:hypothetical protein SK128_027499, partial [Halocaridina rubra]
TKSEDLPVSPPFIMSKPDPEEKPLKPLYIERITEETYIEQRDDSEMKVNPMGAFDDSYLTVLETEIQCSFLCENSTKCLNASKLCDGVNDCEDGSDEKNCHHGSLFA